MNLGFHLLLFCSKEYPIVVTDKCVLIGVFILNLNFLLTCVIFGGVLEYWFLNFLVVRVLHKGDPRRGK